VRLLMIGALLGVPLLGTPARADNNQDFLGQAQRFMNGGSSSTDQERAYERGRRDEDRNRQAERDRERYRNYGGYRQDPDDRPYYNNYR
jgi:hypothetical protein